jgi:hypothetical protein
MRYEEFYFTQNLLEVLIPKMDLPSYEDLYDTVTKRYEQFRTSPNFYNMIDDHGYEYAVQEYVYGVKYGNV